MRPNPYARLVRYKSWADRGLHEVVARNFDRLDAGDATSLLRILDHIHVVDRVFQAHLLGLSHGFGAPRSAALPELGRLVDDAREVDDWYVAFVDGAADFDTPLDFVFTSGEPARMTCGEILLHVCLHGTYHRGNAGILLLKNDISPNDDRMTDFIEEAADAIAAA
jgi:uncharacterized damage-inducible protein DinB